MTYDPNRPATPEPSWGPTDATSSTPTPVAPVPPVPPPRSTLPRRSCGPRAPSRRQEDVVERPPRQRHPRRRRGGRHRRRCVRRRSDHGAGIGGHPAAQRLRQRRLPERQLHAQRQRRPRVRRWRTRVRWRAGLTVRGTVESVDGDTVTIKTANGQTIQVSTGADTTYNTQAPGSASDVTEGTTVQVQLSGITGGGLPAGCQRRPERSGRHGRFHHRHPVTKG